MERADVVRRKKSPGGLVDVNDLGFVMSPAHRSGKSTSVGAWIWWGGGRRSTVAHKNLIVMGHIDTELPENKGKPMFELLNDFDRAARLPGMSSEEMGYKRGAYYREGSEDSVHTDGSTDQPETQSLEDLRAHGVGEEEGCEDSDRQPGIYSNQPG